ncbi:MAG: 2Fe-2S iron-sulfur cluster-binding protein [Candidatus Krumholzibacteriia bacterium]
MTKLTIDGQEIEVVEGTRLFEACTLARGEPLPHFCYHPDLSIAGACRLCQVDVEGMPKLTIACNTMVRDGMVVQTKSKRVNQAVKQVLEMHLINHPVDCPICDQAGECGLQDQYMDYGLYESEVAKKEKVLKRKAKVIGPHVILDQERCVLCSRCVRFCDEVTGTGELGIFNRGDRAELDVAPGVQLDNNYSLNTVDICPVGALTSRDFRFRRRVWLLRSTPGVCPGCATGCNIRIDHEGGRVYRLKPRRNDAVNGPWTCDIGRMTYKALHDERRITEPLLRGEGDEQRVVTWRAGWDETRRHVVPGGVGLVVVNPHQTLEELTLARLLARRLGDVPVVSAAADEDRSSGDDLLLDGDRTPNRMALRWLGLEEVGAEELASRVAAAAGRTVLVYGGDPAAHEAVAGALRDAATVVYWGVLAGATSRLAHVVLPLSMWAEKDGLWVNKQGRIQRAQRAIARPGSAREDWRVLVDLLAAAGEAEVPAGLPAVRRLVGEELELGNAVDLNLLPDQGLVPDRFAAAPAGGES